MSPDKGKTHLILIRHGETDWNVEGRWQGQSDIPLNRRGLQQAEAMAQTLAGSQLDAIYSSDLLRARQTAEQLGRLAAGSIHFDPRLREIDQGLWEGMLHSEIKARHASILNQRRSDPWNASGPGGESVSQVYKRVIRCVEEIIRSHPNKSVAIVSHGFTLALIIAHYLRQPIEKSWDLIPNNCQPFDLLIER